MTRKTLIARLFAAAAAVVVAGGTASAGIIPTQVQVTPEAGNYRWTYAVALPTDMKLQAGDYFTIYDFGGLVSGSITAPEGWSISTANVGPTPDRLSPGDDPNVTNMTFTYTGPTLDTGAKVGLGNFWATSSMGENQSVGGFFVGTNSRLNGSFDQNVTATITPGVPAPSGVPEPTTLALAGLGLPLVFGRKLFAKKAAA